MSDIYVFSPSEEANDYSTMGLVGALTPTECIFKETANGESILTLKHPLDDFGRYKSLQKGNIIVAPVPVRTTPGIQNGSIITTVWTFRVKPIAQLTGKLGKAQRTLYKKKTGSGKMKLMEPGDIATVIQVPVKDGSRWLAKTKYGTGWINPDGFEDETEHVIPDNSSSIEEVQSPWTIMPQYFRIFEDVKTLTDVSVTARHIRYDLLKNMTKWESEDEVDLQTTISGILDGCYYREHGFEAFTNVSNTRAGLSYKRKSPIFAFIDPEEGVCNKFNVGLVSDNYRLYFLHDPGINRGVRIEHGKNMLGINFKVSDDNVVTRIIPIGETKKGEDLFLSDVEEEQYIDSPLINNYPIIHVYELKCDGCKVGDKEKGGGTVTEAIARARMRQQALDLFQEQHVDEPKITMSLEFLNLGDTEEYKQFKNLENSFLFDYIMVKHPRLDINVTARIVAITWNVTLDRMQSVTIGSVGETLANQGIATYQIPNGFSGGKIGDNTLGGGAFKADSIEARHIKSDIIETRHLTAGSITAETIAANALYAQHMIAQVAYIIQANIDKAEIIGAEIDWANIVDLKAIYSQLAKTEIGEAKIGFAQVMDLVAGTAIFTEGIGGKLYISRLAVTDANIGTLSVGVFMVRGPDGHMYAVEVDPDTGTLVPVKKTIDGGDLGERVIGPTHIIENSITAAELNVDQIFASEALIGKITAANIAAGTISTHHVTTDFGATLDLTGNKAIQALVSDDVVRELIADSTRELRVTYDGSGTHLTKDTDTTTMTAYVYESGFDITADIPAAAFIWARDSGDPVADAEWNASRVGLRQVTITKADVNNRSIISCTLLSTGDLALEFTPDPTEMILTVTEPLFGDDSATYDPAVGILTINGVGYIYDQENQTIIIDKNLSASRTTAQFTFSDETGMQARLLILQNRISLMIEDDEGGVTEFRLTPQMIQMISDSIILAGKVGIGDFAPETMLKFQQIQDAADVADAAAAQASTDANYVWAKLVGLCQDANMTYIDGAKIYTGSISADKINVNDLRVHTIGSSTGTGVRMVIDNPNGYASSVDLYDGSTKRGEFYVAGGGLAIEGYSGLYLSSNGMWASMSLLDMDNGTGGRDPVVYVGGHLGCDSPGAYSLGTRPGYPNTRWKNVNITGSVDTSSDRRFKRMITDLEISTFLEEIRPTKFLLGWDGVTAKWRWGFIAQEIQEALIKVFGNDNFEFFHDDDPDHLSLVYAELIAVLVKGWQEHNQKIKDLEERLDRAEAKIAEQDARLLLLEQMLGVK